MTEHAERSRARLHALTADPSDAAAQRYIEEQIEQENIRHQLETAMEHMPESFATVHMLYIPCQINQYPVKAFVDSGRTRLSCAIGLIQARNARSCRSNVRNGVV